MAARSRNVACGLVALWAATLLLSPCQAAAAEIELPQPTGEFAIGTVSYLWEDSSRREVALESEQARWLRAQLWYPAQRTVESRGAPYVEGPLAGLLAQMLGPQIAELRSHAERGAEMAREQESYPVVLFSPGFGITRILYTILCEELASHGYVVAILDHPHLNLVESPDGELMDPAGGFWETFPAKGQAKSLEEATRKLDFAFDHFAADQLFVLAQLKELTRHDPNGVLTGRLDLGRVGSLGHSAGALGPQALSLRDSPVDAVVLYDVEIDRLRAGPKIVVPVAGTVTKPVLAVRLEYAPPPLETFEEQLAARLYDVQLEGASHLSVADIPFLGSAVGGDTDGQRAAAETLLRIATYTRSFLDTYVKSGAGPTTSWSFETDEGATIRQYAPPSER